MFSVRAERDRKDPTFVPEKDIIKITSAGLFQSLYGALPALEEMGLGKRLALHGDFIESLTAPNQSYEAVSQELFSGTDKFEIVVQV